jgi:hypothetical protein
MLAPVTADPSVVLVGGQAIAYWAGILGLVRDAATDDLLASKDIDFEGGAEAASAAAELLQGRARFPSFDHHTPVTGVVFFDDSDGIERRIDFLAAPLGLDAGDVRATERGGQMIGRPQPRQSASSQLAFCDMRTLYLRNVPDDVVERLERLAARDATSVSAVAIRELSEVSRRADNPALLGTLPDLAIDTVAIVRDLDAERADR